jgi:antitoxin (DNA-binding transcriptional repressor) of toxin-antitoxin stability system
MHAVGVRELKARLSHWLRKVREGEVVLVTDRGEVVAEIRPGKPPADVPPEMAGLWRLSQRIPLRLGEPARGRRLGRPPWSFPDGTAKALLDEDREDRI